MLTQDVNKCEKNVEIEKIIFFSALLDKMEFKWYPVIKKESLKIVGKN